MDLALQQFGRQIRDILTADPGPDGREQVRNLLELWIRVDDLATRYLTDDQPRRRVLYKDPQLGFAILGHVFHDARRTLPHDHGSSWAIYGQVQGETIMDDWEAVSPAGESSAGKVKKVRSSVLRPGEARVYNEGEIHSPRRDGAAKLIRIEGQPDQPGPSRVWEPIQAA